MVMKVTVKDQKVLKKLFQAVDTKRAALEQAVGAYNEAISAMSEAAEEYNQSLDDAHASLEDIHRELSEEFDEKSDKWRESDKGEAAMAWLETFGEVLDALQNPVSIDEPEPIDFDSMLDEGPSEAFNCLEFQPED